MVAFHQNDLKKKKQNRIFCDQSIMKEHEKSNHERIFREINFELIVVASRK